MVSFLDHSAEREGLIVVQHSIQKPAASKTVSLQDVRYLFIDPHGSLAVPPVDGLEGFLARYSNESIRRYLAVERDLGVPELRDRLLRLLPNAMAISFTVNRGFMDPNRVGEFALRNILQQAPQPVREVLEGRHVRSLTAVDGIVAALRPGVKISLLHSMEPFCEADQSVHELDLSDPANLELFLTVRTNVGVGHGSVVSTCFITGKGDEPTRDDELFRRTLQGRLTGVGIPFAEDSPFATKKGKHKTSDYMQARPGDVNAVDWPRDLLGTGEIADGTFSLTDSVADDRKVEEIATRFAEVLLEVST